MTESDLSESQEGIRILSAIDGARGVNTWEGTIGPLLNAKGGGCHFIDVPPGAYMDEHAHEKESLIYTVRGEWVLCSREKRWHMKAGSLFWFGDLVPTGYENPFAVPALLLIFKMEERAPGYDEAMLARLLDTRDSLEREHAAGTRFAFAEIPDDHPAKQFARGLLTR